MILLDGAMGEGGGQILRSALGLSMVTGQPFTLERIRAGRARPGLLRQHLACVRAALELSGGRAEGAELGSTRLRFQPGAVRPGSYRFAVGSAGSTGLVLQAALPALLTAEAESELQIEGGTHNPSAPPFPFLQTAFGPRLGLELELLRPGFFPAGGGCVRARVRPGQAAIDLFERGPGLELHGHAMVSALSPRIAHAALGRFRQVLDLPSERLHLHSVDNPVGPGFAAWIEARFAGGAEVFSAFGERRDTEGVAEQALAELQGWLDHGQPVGEHLADQLMIPIALLGGGLRTGPLSSHARTNRVVVERFLPGRLRVEEDEAGVVIRGEGPSV